MTGYGVSVKYRSIVDQKFGAFHHKNRVINGVLSIKSYLYTNNVPMIDTRLIDMA